MSSVAVQSFQCWLGYGLIHRSIVTMPPPGPWIQWNLLYPIHLGKKNTHSNPPSSSMPDGPGYKSLVHNTPVKIFKPYLISHFLGVFKWYGDL